MDPRALKKIQREWYMRLRDEGFEDVEYIGADGTSELRSFSGNSFRSFTILEVESRRDFFLLCSSYCERAKFKNRTERKIMELFCDGKSKEEIRKELKLHRTTVYGVVRKYLILFGLYGK